MIAQADRARVMVALSLGLGRHALPALPGFDALPQDDRPLAALALTGQLLRLGVLPQPAGEEGGWRLPDDPVPTLPDPARSALLRLAGRVDAATLGMLSPLLLDHIATAGRRLHPFDLPRLGGLLGRNAALGPVERAWRDRGAAAPDAPVELTVETWRQGSLAARVQFLRQLRGRDPAQGRELLATCLAAEPAKARDELLGALGTGLGADDRPFLLVCATDRAASVRQTAAALLTREAGAGARLAAVQAAFVLATKGLLRRRLHLGYQPPVERGKPVPAARLLEQARLSELAHGWKVPLAEVPEIVMDDELRHALAAAAVRDGLTDVAAGLLAQVNAPAWPRDVEQIGPPLAGLAPGERLAFASKTLQSAAVIDCNWMRLANLLGAPLDVECAARLLASKPWRDFVGATAADAKDPDPSLVFLAALMPAALAARCRDSLAPLAPERRPRTTLAFAFLETLAAPAN